jgi:hypothetical protein
MSKCLLQAIKSTKTPIWEIYMTLRYGKWDFEFFRFKNLSYGYNRDYYDGWHIALNTGILNVYVYW